MFVGEADHVQRLAGNGHALWNEELKSTSLLGPRVDACELDEHKFVSIPIFSFLLAPLIGRQWLAAGDAASCYDPLSSQGIHKALVDAEDAASHVAHALGFAKAPRCDYSQRLEDRFHDYLALREHLYGLEQRWPDAPFWQRRSQATELARRQFARVSELVAPPA
jgi:2-polyprenyl-6-methoxyphenol hydroxylase-like FAD-dependent oxidoreductase